MRSGNPRNVVKNIEKSDAITASEYKAVIAKTRRDFILLLITSP